jgi:nitric oxide reductase subunit C
MASDKQKLMIVVSLLIAFLSYSCFIYTSLPVKNYKIPQESNIGKTVWQQYNCNACHQVYGLGGYIGPDLTNVYSLRGTAYIKAFLGNGTASMPNFHLSEKEMNALVAYLKTIDASGNSDPRKYTIKYDGSIEE